jgi:hypothetical protein
VQRGRGASEPKQDEEFSSSLLSREIGKKDGDSMLLAADSAEKAAEWKSFLDEMVNKAANHAPPVQKKRRQLKRASFGVAPENMMKAIDRTRNNQRQATGVGKWRVAAITNGVRVLEEIVSAQKRLAASHFSFDCPLIPLSLVMKVQENGIARRRSKNDDLALIVAVFAVVVGILLAIFPGGAPPFGLSLLLLIFALTLMLIFAFLAGVVGVALLSSPSAKLAYPFDTINVNPCMQVATVVNATSDEIFRKVLDVEAMPTWDSSVARGKVVKSLDEHSDVIHIQYRPVRLLGLLWTQPRDICWLRYWRREEDGCYIICYQPSPLQPRSKGHVRAIGSGGGYTIAPQRLASALDSDQAGFPSCLVSQVIHFDPAGLSVLWKLVGLTPAYYESMLMSTLGESTAPCALRRITSYY